MIKKSKCTDCGQIVEYYVKWYKKCPVSWCLDCAHKHGGIRPMGQRILVKHYPALYEALAEDYKANIKNFDWPKKIVD